MRIIKFSLLLLLTAIAFIAEAAVPIVGAARHSIYYPQLKDKKIALLTNHTGRVGDIRTLDYLLSLDLDVCRVFSPEHGIDGKADAGKKVAGSVDPSTGIEVTSLYGGKIGEEALRQMVRQADVVVVDLQDVGTRFYTYYITMMRLMDAAAATERKVMVFDRPNPNGMYVDGPILDMKHKSGVGALPIPVVHGMTLGELAQMIVGEGWLKEGRKLDLTVIPCLNYTHRTRYSLPVAPSPNLKSDIAVALYPSLCFFEGTPLSVGRGTDSPFTLFGGPELRGMPFSFTPKSMPGATNPPCKNQLCHGRDLSHLPVGQVLAAGLDPSYLIEAYKAYNGKSPFFTRFFTLLAGTTELEQMIREGKSADEIKASWDDGIREFRKRRAPYLLYEE